MAKGLALDVQGVLGEEFGLFVAREHTDQAWVDGSDMQLLLFDPCVVETEHSNYHP